MPDISTNTLHPRRKVNIYYSIWLHIIKTTEHDEAVILASVL